MKCNPLLFGAFQEETMRVPPGWRLTAIRHLLADRVTDGPHETPEFLTEGVPFLSVDGIQDGKLVFDGCRYISPEDHARYQRKASPRRGDILLGKAASTGKIAQVNTDIEFSIWSPLALLRPNLLTSSSFLEYSLKSNWLQYQIEILCTSNTQKNISMSDIPRLLILLPDRPTQEAIVTFLDCETTRIDQLIERVGGIASARIAAPGSFSWLLQEKRSALITAAVTGQIDVAT